MKPILTAAILACLPAAAAAAPVTVPTSGSVADAVARLETAVADAGGRVFTVVDFGGGAKSVGEDIGNIQLVIFGDPRIGAAALSIDSMAALDLPGKILVYESGGETVMAYDQPAEMLAEHDFPPDAPIFERMSDTLERITTAAAE